MKKIDNLDDNANQYASVTLSDKSQMVLTLHYRPIIQRWTFDITYGDSFTVNNLMLCVHPNILRSFRRTIPFGLSVVSVDGADPFTRYDFSSGRISLYALDNTGDYTDVAYVESHVFGGAL